MIETLKRIHELKISTVLSFFTKIKKRTYQKENSHLGTVTLVPLDIVYKT